MQLFSFSVGLQLRLFKETYTLTEVRNDRITLRNERTDAARDYELSTLLVQFRAGNLKPLKPPRRARGERPPARVKRTAQLLADASSNARDAAKRIYEYLRAIEESGVPFNAKDEGLAEVLREVAVARGESHPPSFSTLSRRRGRLMRSGGDMAACLPQYNLRGAPGKGRFAPGIESAMERAVDNFYMTIEGQSMSASYEEFRRLIIDEHCLKAEFDEAELPSFASFRRRVIRRGAYELYASRNGERAAAKAFRFSQPPRDEPGFNEVWEVDHTRLDLFLVDAKRGITAKRPRLTVIIDAMSRAVMGFDVDFTGDSAQAVLNALCHAITPKSYVPERYPDIKGAWPCHGVPLVLRCDNGKEFHSTSLKRACDELGIRDIEYCAVGRPTSKGRVERFFRTLSEGFLRSLPGYAGPDLKRRKELEEVNLPVIDRETFIHQLHIWVVDVYMQSNHTGRREA